MQMIEMIEKKRDGQPLTEEEIRYVVEAYTSGDIPDYQVSALLMAIFLNGLTTEETVWLTAAMLHSGIVVDLGDIPGIKVDKHSTGGVGDKTSLIIAPICAALGIPVPMISGRGLGHTGGTLDKLESIPGFKVNLDLEQYRTTIRQTGLCLIGQTREIAPADKKLYALRDVTGTVANRSLISASIMSKKMAEGIDALVLDVKTGRGAFMERLADAEALAELMISIGRKMNKRMSALITDMNQPLGTHIGNALEVIESVEILKGNRDELRRDLVDLSLALAAQMIVLGGKAANVEAALKMAQSSIDDGSALAKFEEIVTVQNGDASSLSDYSRLPTADHKHVIPAAADGCIQALDALDIGRGAVLLGAGRQTLDAGVDHGVGVVLHRKIGSHLAAGEAVMDIHYNDPEKLSASLPHFENAINIGPEPQEKPEVIIKTLGDFL